MAGSVGPLNVTLSLSPRVDDPSYRTVTFDQVYAAYAEQMARSPTAARPAADRDDLRHAERQGRHRRRPRRRPATAAVDLGHDRRPVRPDAVRADGRGVLDVGRARGAADHRRELLARRRGTAPARGRAVPAGRHLRQQPSERGTAQRVRRLRRAAARDRGPAARVRRGRHRQHRRRLLRDHAGPHRADRRGGGRACRGASSRRPRPRPGSAAWSRSRSGRTPGSS